MTSNNSILNYIAKNNSQIFNIFYLLYSLPIMFLLSLSNNILINYCKNFFTVAKYTQLQKMPIYRMFLYSTQISDVIERREEADKEKR